MPIANPMPQGAWLRREADAVLEILGTAGGIVSGYFAQDTAVEFKDGDEPVTVADRECSAFITSKLRDMFPDDGILSEEELDTTERLHKERVWIIDPLDGTKEFVMGLQEFVIMVGLAIQGKPCLGIVLQPTSGLVYLGVPGTGTWVHRDGRTRPAGIGHRDEPAPLRAAVSRSHMTELMETCLDEAGFAERTRIGSAGLKAGLVAEGRADCWFHASVGLKEWDVCAPHAVLEAAGATVTDCWGRDRRYNQADYHLRHGLIASSGHRHAQLLGHIGRVCADHGFHRANGFA